VNGNWTGNYAEVGAKIYDAWQQLHAAGKSDLTKARVFEILPRESEISWFSQRPMRPIRTTPVAGTATVNSGRACFRISRLPVNRANNGLNYPETFF
jgi:hypothetical protein